MVTTTLATWRPRFTVLRLLTILVTLLALLAPLFTGVHSARAATTTPFNIDGNVPDTGTTNLPDPSGNAQELGPVNANSTKLGVINTAPVPMLADTNPNAQVDLNNWWMALKSDSAGNQWLYLAWQRDSNSGSGAIMAEFDKLGRPSACDYTLPDTTLINSCNPWANRQAGDYMLWWDQQGNSTTILLRQFTGTGWTA